MKKQLLKKISVLLITLFMVTVAIFMGIAIQPINVYAAGTALTKDVFKGISSFSTIEDLYNATNTYKYNGENTASDRKYVYYDTSAENNEIVSEGAPLITVLTHGLNGKAYHWSNDGTKTFAYDKDSLFARLNTELSRNGGNGANIFWAQMINSKSFYLYDLNNSNNINGNGEYDDIETISSITDISKHIIIVFEATQGTYGASNGYNYDVYEEFNYMLSKIVYDVKLLSGGELPRINLIGHSRGGITNLMYALDHPKMVASMFSMGTPYFGSDTASTSLGASIAGNSDGLHDIVDRNIYSRYFNRWYSDYNKLYSQINAYALGGYSDSDFAFDALIEARSSGKINELSVGGLTALKWSFKSCPHLLRQLNGTAEIIDFLVSLFRDEDYDENDLESWVQVIADIQYFIKDENKNWWDNFWDNLKHNVRFLGSPYFMNDLLVDLPSQTGVDKHSEAYRTYGFNVYTKCYRNFDVSVTEKVSSPSDAAAVHNLEARDNDFINYILSKIELGKSESGYVYMQTSDTTAKLVGYRGKLLNDGVELPSQIDSLTIDSIGYDLFKGMGVEITSILIPSTVQRIDNGAFINLESVSIIEFAPDSNLNSIGREAFAGCAQLQSFVVTEKVTNIGLNAFAGCVKLENLTVEAGNSSYSVSDGVLFNKDGTELVYYPESKTNSAYTIPSAVRKISPYAFHGNCNLEKVYFSDNNPSIGECAFQTCSNLTEIYFYDFDAPDIGVCAFADSGYTIYVPLCKQSDYAIAFNSYSNKLDSISIVITFVDNDKIVTTIDGYYGETILSLPDVKRTGYDFDAWNSKADFTGSTYTVGDIWNFDKDITLYSKWTPKHYTINFTGYEGENFENKTVVYDSIIGTLPTIEIKGYEFFGWQDEFGNYFYEETVWTKDYNVVLKPDLRAKEYTIKFNPNGGDGNSSEQKITYGTVISSLPRGSKTGHSFLGWNMASNGSGLTVKESDTYLFANNIELFAQYSAENYWVTFDKVGGEGGSNGVDAKFGKGMPEGNNIQAPTKKGYVFDGYFLSLNGTSHQYYDKNMKSQKTWDVAESTTLSAKWIAKSYYVEFDKLGVENGANGVIVTFGSAMPTGLYAPTRTGYSFQGYYSTAVGEGTQYYKSDMTSANIWNIDSDNPKLYARWEVRVYHIELNQEGGMDGDLSVNATYLEEMPKAVAPKRDGFNFNGYYIVRNGVEVYYYNPDMSSARNWDIADNATLHAKWVGKKYNVELINDKAPKFDRVLLSNSASDIIYIGFIPETSGTIKLYTSHTMGDPYLHLYDSSFKMLNSNDDGYGNRDAQISHAVVKGNKYYVGFRSLNSSLTIGAVHYSGVSITSFYGFSEVTATFDEPLPQQKIQSIAGYTFLGYYNGKDGTGQKYYDGPNMTSCALWKIDRNEKLYALWQANTYNITFRGEGEQLITKRNVTYGEPLSDFFAPKKPGYAFDGFYDVNGNKICKMQVVNDQQTADINGLDRAYVEKVFCVNGVWDYPANVTLYGRWDTTPFKCSSPYMAFCGTQYIGGDTASLTHGASKIAPVAIDGYIFNHFEYRGKSYLADENIPVVLYRSLSNTIHLDGQLMAYYDEDTCIAAGSLITLADGSQVPVEKLTGNEMLLVWNLYTGTYDTAPILFIDSDPENYYSVINLTFSDGTVVKVISEHGFWDYDLNMYVYLNKDANKYIWHWFNKGDSKVQLIGVEIKEEYTRPYSPVTYGHLCYYVNGMLSMPGGINGIFNIFEVDAELFKYRETAMYSDIEKYGLFTYEEFAEILPVSEDVFNAFNVQYFKVAIGKGLTTLEQVAGLYSKYENFL